MEAQPRPLYVHFCHPDGSFLLSPSASVAQFSSLVKAYTNATSLRTKADIADELLELLQRPEPPEERARFETYATWVMGLATLFTGDDALVDNFPEELWGVTTEVGGRCYALCQFSREPTNPFAPPDRSSTPNDDVASPSPSNPSLLPETRQVEAPSPTTRSNQSSSVGPSEDRVHLTDNIPPGVKPVLETEGGVVGKDKKQAQRAIRDFVQPLSALLSAITLPMLAKKKKKKGDYPEIKYDELEVESLLGVGGYGEVWRARWKDNEVAVKMLATHSVSKAMVKNFRDEVRVMAALRHPNVVLFMGACTKPPRMAIVMEFMALGSLFDLLHNELVPDVPHELKVRMLYQAAKGMHFLHSSDIVHRDLKSLNLLLDAKWNVKVSDFGLTKFKAGMLANEANEVGTIQWAAPEVLCETPNVDYILADVYSFGIVMWEVLSREVPYSGISAPSVALSVLRDNARPTIPPFVPQDYEDLMISCWHRDPVVRPTFLEVMTRLGDMIEGQRSHSSPWMTSKDRSQWGLSSSSSGGSGQLDDSGKQEGAGTIVGIRPPEGEVAIVFTDITCAKSLWETDAASMRDATLLHNNLIRGLLKKHQGYEVMKYAGEGSFCLVFPHASDAIEWCMDVQTALLKVEWPEDLLTRPGAAPELDVDGRVLYNGLRIRMGVHVGVPKFIRDRKSSRYECVGAPVNLTARITALAQGGQILLSGAAFNKVKSTKLAKEDKRLHCLGAFDITERTRLYDLKARGLEGRFFGDISDEAVRHVSMLLSTTTPASADLTDTSDDEAKDCRGKELLTQARAFPEDEYMTSANLCRWIIDYNEIQIGEQGSYGIVSRGKWKGVDVAVKRIKQKLDERTMLEFRAEVAFLVELDHPNVVLFLGACVQRPNLAIVTDFVKRGSLKSIIEDDNVKLPFQQSLRMLRGAALGINYLHSLDPAIIHRDIKPSNLLVDESWNVKVADFGFARIKEENATMTYCDTPAWTAPEIIRGEKYSEKADIYSFGVVMWEMLTRRQPYAGRNFIGVSLDVLQGKRPPIPPDCPSEYKRIMTRCWHYKPEKRPKMENVVHFFDSLLPPN